MASDLPRLSDTEIVAAALERYARDEAKERNLGPPERMAEHGRRAARARELADDYRRSQLARVTLTCPACGHWFTTSQRPAVCPRCREQLPAEEAA